MSANGRVRRSGQAAAAAKATAVEPTVNKDGAENTPTEAPKSEPKEEPEKEEPKEEPIPEGACEVYGQVDMNSKACKSCPALEACKVKTAAMKKASPKAAGSGERAPRAPRPAGTGEFTLFGRCKTTSQAGLIEKALEEPHTAQEIADITGCTLSRVKSHINWLVANHKDNCTKVVGDGGKIHFTVNEKTAA